MIDAVFNILGILLSLIPWFVWAVAMYAFWLMRKAQCLYRERWREALRITEEVQIENESLIQQRDDYLGLNQSLIEIIDEAEARWSQGVIPGERTPDEQASFDRAENILTRATEIVMEGRRRQAEAHEAKREIERKRIMLQKAQARATREVGPRLVSSASHARLVERYKRRRMVSR